MSTNMLKQKPINNSDSFKQITWEEVTINGTILKKEYTCKSRDAMWHMSQLRKSPDVIVNIKMKA